MCDLHTLYGIVETPLSQAVGGLGYTLRLTYQSLFDNEKLSLNIRAVALVVLGLVKCYI